MDQPLDKRLEKARPKRNQLVHINFERTKKNIYIGQHQTHPLVLVTFSSHPNDNHLCTQNQLSKYKSDCMQGMKIVNNKHESLYGQNKK